ncbi:MAG: metal-sensing transcriptional repressor [Hyphomonadaceae bacterium JAD_PAG50586_4]|nr:MAG: metal-sensing transcriptional repressor [Hyphomonadaceae bacterium JAD_PAG50586_4]
MRQAKHPSREPIIKRLRRAEGHLHSVVEMLTAKRSSSDIAQQLQAVESAVTAAKRLLVHDQMQHCLSQGDASGGTLRELKHLTKFL